MGMTAARHAREVVANAETVVALEALGAARALDLRAPLEPDPRRAVPAALRGARLPSEEDREFGPDIHAAVRLVRGGDLVSAAETETGLPRLVGDRDRLAADHGRRDRSCPGRYGTWANVGPSRSTRSARLPSSSVPSRSSRPRTHAGFAVAATSASVDIP